MFKTLVGVRQHQKVVHKNAYRFYCSKCGHGMQKRRYLSAHVCGRVRRVQPTELQILNPELPTRKKQCVASNTPTESKDMIEKLRMDIKQPELACTDPTQPPVELASHADTMVNSSAWNTQPSTIQLTPLTIPMSNNSNMPVLQSVAAQSHISNIQLGVERSISSTFQQIQPIVGQGEATHAATREPSPPKTVTCPLKQATESQVVKMGQQPMPPITVQPYSLPPDPIFTVLPSNPDYPKAPTAVAPATTMATPIGQYAGGATNNVITIAVPLSQTERVIVEEAERSWTTL